jgi:hypothetical protein
MNGWIYLHRKLLNWRWHDCPKTLAVWIRLLVDANWKETEYHEYKIPRGSGVCGLHALSEKTGCSVRAVRTALTRLKSTGEITTKSTNQFTIYTVVKYEEYQRAPTETTSETTSETTNNRQTNDKQTTTSEERKKERITRARKPGDSRITQIKLLFQKKYSEKYTVPHGWSGREAKQCQTLLAYLDEHLNGEDKVSVAGGMIDEYLKRPDPYAEKERHPFGLMVSAPQKYRADPKQTDGGVRFDTLPTGEDYGAH